MRLLFLTNFYPPINRGGYEQWCQEVAESLHQRGHEVMVLTSRYGSADFLASDPIWLRRELYLEMELASSRNSVQFFISRKAREQDNLYRLCQLITKFTPDIVLIWGMWNLQRSLPALAETLKPDRVVYYMGDYWPTLPSQYEFYWESSPKNGLTAIPKYALKPVARAILANERQPDLKLANVIFPSAFMRDEFTRKGVSLQKTKIIYGAIDTCLYKFNDAPPHTNGADCKNGLSLLYVGRLTRDKGVHTAVEALGDLVHQYGFRDLRLTIVGAGDSEYETCLYKLAQKKEIESNITFVGAQPKETIPQYYRQADVLLFTSIWPEPFGRVIVEAMASGVVVVGTATGGAAEILTANENALIFPAGDAAGLAKQLACLVESPLLRRRLAEAGQRTAFEKFDMRRMTEEIETYLQTILHNR